MQESVELSKLRKDLISKEIKASDVRYPQSDVTEYCLIDYFNLSESSFNNLYLTNGTNKRRLGLGEQDLLCNLYNIFPCTCRL